MQGAQVRLRVRSDFSMFQTYYFENKQRNRIKDEYLPELKQKLAMEILGYVDTDDGKIFGSGQKS